MSPAAGGADTVERLRADRDRLARELAEARDEIAQLKQRQTQVLDRINWVLKTLDSLAEE